MVRLAVFGSADQISACAAIEARFADLQIVDLQKLAGHPPAVDVPHDRDADARRWQDLLRTHSDAFDAALFWAPVSQYIELVCATARARKDVLVDLAFATSREAIDTVARTCASSEVQLIIGRPLRQMAYQQAVSADLDSGRLGTPGLLRIVHWTSPASTTEPEPIRRTVELAIGEVDLACWLFGAAPDVVFASELSGQVAGHGMQFHFGFPAGGMAIINCHQALPLGAPPFYSLNLIGSRGAAYADDHHNTNLVIGGHVEGFLVDQGSRHLRVLMQELLDRREKSHTADEAIEEARRAFSVIAAARDSADQQRSAIRHGNAYRISPN